MLIIVSSKLTTYALPAYSIVAGIPLRLAMEGSGPEGMLLSLPGRFVRRESASRIWIALFSSWEDYRRGEHSNLDDLPDTLTSVIRQPR